MKTISYCVALMFIALISCKKELQKTIPMQKDIDAVSVYLKGQESVDALSRTRNVQALKKYLDWSKIHREDLHGGEHLIVIPVKDGFRQEFKVKEGTIITVLAYENSVGKIRNMRIVLYTAPQGTIVKSLPENTFQYITVGPMGKVTDGTYRFLGIAGRPQWVLGYKNGRLFSEGTFTTTPQNQSLIRTDAVKANMTCTDWYITTIITWTDGTQYQFEEFVARTCDSCGDTLIDSMCDDLDSGGGGGSTVTEYLRIARKVWTVYPNSPDNDTIGVQTSIAAQGTGSLGGSQFVDVIWEHTIPVKMDRFYSYTETGGGASYTNYPSPRVTAWMSGTFTLFSAHWYVADNRSFGFYDIFSYP